MNEQDAIVEVIELWRDSNELLERIATALERSNEEKENNSEAG